MVLKCLATLPLSYLLREMYHGNKWRTDKRFATPMIVCSAGHIFVNDFVCCRGRSSVILAKIVSFFKKVLNDWDFSLPYKDMFILLQLCIYCTP